MQDQASGRRNRTIRANTDNAVPTGRHLYWDRDEHRLISSECELLSHELGCAPPPNELGAILMHLLRVLLKKPGSGSRFDLRKLWRMRD